MKILRIIIVLLAFMSCNAQEKKQETKATEIKKTFVECQEIEPVKPSETEFYDPVPPTVNPTSQNGAPSDAIVLFDGTNLDAWEHSKASKSAEWIVNADGSMTVKNKSGDIQTKQKFGSVQLHIEWKSPKKIEGKGQHRANSGVFLQKRYEVQVLDNNDNDTYVNGQVGSIYKQAVPLAKASVPTGEWNSYDIIFHEPEFNDQGNKTKSATITVLHNGVLIQDHYIIKGTTEFIGWPKNKAHGKAPLLLQDHKDNSRVSYRNIWIRELN